MLAGSESDSEKKFHLWLHRKRKPKGKKTNIYVIGKSSFAGEYGSPKEDNLGEIRWHGAFRQYVFYPYSDTMWSKGCLEIVNKFLNDKNKRYRNKLRRKAR